MERMADDFIDHRRQVVQHSGGNVDRSIVSLEISVTSVNIKLLLLQDLQKPVQHCLDEHKVDQGPLGDVVGVDFPPGNQRRP
jgi:hypothetical protein